MKRCIWRMIVMIWKSATMADGNSALVLMQIICHTMLGLRIATWTAGSPELCLAGCLTAGIVHKRAAAANGTSNLLLIGAICHTTPRVKMTRGTAAFPDR